MYTQTRHIIALLILLLVSASSPAADIWYEDNNLGRAGGMPADFLEKFKKPDTFKQATGYIDVYMVRANILDDMEDKDLTEVFYAFLKKHNIKLAIDAVGATWTQVRGRSKGRSQEIAQFERLKRLGVQVDYLSLQSALSKVLREGQKSVEYPFDKRIDDIVAYSKDVRAIYPQVRIGIIDSLPAHEEYREPYRKLKDGLAKAGMELAFIHLDIPFDMPSRHTNNVTWQTVREVENYVENDLRIRFGLFASSRLGGHASSQAFHQRSIAAMKCFAGAGGTPSDFIIASWYPNPQKTIPETATGNDYPAMRTVLEFGRELEQIEKSGTSQLSTQKLEGGLMCDAGKAKKRDRASRRGALRRPH